MAKTRGERVGRKGKLGENVGFGLFPHIRKKKKVLKHFLENTVTFRCTALLVYLYISKSLPTIFYNATLNYNCVTVLFFSALTA